MQKRNQSNETHFVLGATLETGGILSFDVNDEYSLFREVFIQKVRN